MTSLREAERFAKAIDKHTSIYDPSRQNIGKIYRDLQIGADHLPILVGDMANELTKSLVVDINEALCLPRKDDKPFFLVIVEKRDLQMPNAMYRHRQTLSFRPYPEDNTTVFWKDPKAQIVRWCWQLPHWAEMDLILANEDQFDPSYIANIKAWKANNLRPFGFYWNDKEKWLPNPKWVDKDVSVK